MLEDDPQRIRLFREACIGLDATFAESCEEAVRKFAPPYHVLSLDHDLGGEVFVDSAVENTGAGFCRWLADASDDFQPAVVVHSYNPVGAANMAKTLRDKGHRVVVQPFGPTVLGFLGGLAPRTEPQSPEVGR